jgi:hypothetical protein
MTAIAKVVSSPPALFGMIIRNRYTHQEKDNFNDGHE